MDRSPGWCRELIRFTPSVAALSFCPVKGANTMATLKIELTNERNQALVNLADNYDLPPELLARLALHAFLDMVYESPTPNLTLPIVLEQHESI